AMQKTMLAGTEIAATISVRGMAASASRSESAVRQAGKPARSGSTKTATRGRSRKTARKTTATAMSRPRMPRPSVVTRVNTGGGRVERLASDMAQPPARPGLQQVDGEQQDEGDRQHDRGNRG